MSLAISTSTSSPSTQHAPLPTPSSRNPITLRLRKILGTTFTDPATTEALQTLSHLYSTPPTSGVAASHVQSPEHDTNDDDNSSDLDSEGTAPRDGEPGYADIPNDTAARVRKNLQRDLENKLAEGSQHFLKAFREVDQVCQPILLLSLGPITLRFFRTHRNSMTCRKLWRRCDDIVTMPKHNSS